MKCPDIIGSILLDQIHDVLAQASEYRGDNDHGHDTNHDAKDGQKASEFVGAQIGQGHYDIFKRDALRDVLGERLFVRTISHSSSWPVR